ncbi:MAG: cytochrome P450 [Myxococcota bacterium]
MTTRRFDPYDPEFIQDPYPTYARYRQSDPVHWGLPQAPGAEGCWYLFRAREAYAVLKDPRFRRRIGPPPMGDAESPFVRMSRHWLLSSDPPAHTRLRATVNRAFTARVAGSLRPQVARWADALIDRADGAMDLVRDFAFPLSFEVITTILGIDPDDRAAFRTWSSDIAEGINFRRADAETLVRASRGTEAMLAYFTDRVARRRAHPGDDLMSQLIAAETDDALSEEELMAMCIQLVFAGHETTVNWIGNAVLALLRSQEQLERLRAVPSLLPRAMGELLRYDASVQTAAARRPTEDVDVGGRRIRQAETVIAVLGAANRDPEVYAEPEAIRLDRAERTHRSFGVGIHACLGAFLAQMEAEVGVGRLLARAPELRLADRFVPTFREHVVLRGLNALCIEW